MIGRSSSGELLQITRSRGGRAQLLTPPAIGSWEDPNSILTGFTWDGTWLSVTLQAPAASRDTPVTGCGYILPITNMVGQSLAAALNAADNRQPIIAIDAVMPADTIAHITLTTSSTIAGATNGLGVAIGSDGTGMRARRTTMTSVAGGGTFDATMRYATMFPACSSTSVQSTRGYLAAAIASDGTTGLFSSSFVDVTTTYNSTNASYVAVTFGWVAGSGVAGSIVKIKPMLFAGNMTAIPGVL